MSDIEITGEIRDTLSKEERENGFTIEHDISIGCTIRTKEPEWNCYLYGAKPGQLGVIILRVDKGDEPNIVVRFFMKHLLGCTWVRNKPSAC